MGRPKKAKGGLFGKLRQIRRDVEAKQQKAAGTFKHQAMILPFPLPDADSPHQEHPIVLVNMKGTGKIMEDAEKVFPKFHPMTNSRSSAGPAARGIKSLAVFDVGSYHCSVALSVADLDRINPDVFKVNPAVAAILGEHYAAQFGFLICQLQAEGKQHPIAYIHDVIQPGRLFVPCRHEHGGGSSRDTVKWDHLIYSVNTTAPGKGADDAGESPEEKLAQLTEQHGSHNIMAAETSAEQYLKRFRVALAEPAVSFRRLERKGGFPNQDLLLDYAAVEGSVGATSDDNLVFPPAATEL